MELRHLRYFRAVAEELHFGRAAQRLHIAQPPLSQQIRQLETELGVELLVRSTRRVELTAAGEDYLRRVVEILDAVDAAGRHAARIADGTRGHLAIGCVGSATYSLLPRLVRTLGERLPGVDVEIRGEMLAPAQIVGLRSGELDLAVLRPTVPYDDLTVETLRTDRLIVAVPEGHRLAELGSPRYTEARSSLRHSGSGEGDAGSSLRHSGSGDGSDSGVGSGSGEGGNGEGRSRSRVVEEHGTAVTLAQLRDEEFVMHAGHGMSVMYDVVVSLCARAGFVPKVRHEIAETSTLVTFVAAGLGVAVVPEPTAALDIAGVRYLPLADATGQLDLAAAYLTSARSPVVDQVLTVLRETASD
ncbi:LysR family transcriptional regulator [Gordonia sp. TBRC 11910]|uniref:LysR family transcriptional regulator n=1 Tax=Gordonia asplenii TaxID=2725283 RepID=A0A848KW84_9ACTN|nr:LysR substrate-binding domain-containing protein [Gordonia asplenii]NMO02850.1 LysR family transcriptional regulator [Gordonia asplenii]